MGTSGAGSGIPDWYGIEPEQEIRQTTDRIGSVLTAAFAEVRLVVLDADGVMTDGSLLYGPGGEAFKAFHSHDGLGLVLARTVGIKRAVLTGRNSAIVGRRCGELRFESIKLGRFDKLAALTEILAETSCGAGQTLYMGDDLIDLPVLRAVGLPVTVPAAPAELRSACRYTTTAAGGAGAVREVLDLVLKSTGRMGLALGRVVDPSWGPTAEELSSEQKD